MRQSFLLLFVAIAGCQGRPGDSAALRGNPPVDIRRLELAGLHNVFRVSDRVVSGSSPDGPAGFESLRQLGIKTIVSVDGATPDVAEAERLGMEYVHLPIGYDGIPRPRLLALVKLMAVRPGPIYVHCHHGLHRGPVAVAAMQMCETPGWDVTTAELWLQKAGTSPQYPGLIHLPRTLRRPTAEELAGTPADFPATDLDNKLAGTMVNVDARWDSLKLIKAAGWAAPAGSPDLDPPHEALQLAEHYREAARLDPVKKKGPALTRLFTDAEAAARTLESELRARPFDPEKAGAAFARVAAQCAACHNQFRDRPDSR